MFEPREPGTQLSLELAVDDNGSCVVRESRRARRLSVRILRSGHIEVVKPRRASRAQVLQFLHLHRQWIETKRREALRNALPKEAFPPARIELRACAESYRVHLPGGTGPARARLRGNGLLEIRGDVSDARAVRAALRRWLMVRARVVLSQALSEVAAATRLSYERTTIRRQRSRWGSCSSRGTISLNCCLLFQPPQVLRYLLVHELAHTQHMNHSKRFWQCVAMHCPQYRELDRELLCGWRAVPHWVFDSRIDT